MITDLLVVGLMVAVAPDLPVPGVARPAAAEQRSEAATGSTPCQVDPRGGYRVALLEAHASVAAMPPFSLARLGTGAAGPALNGAKEKDAGGCKS